MFSICLSVSGKNVSEADFQGRLIILKTYIEE